MATIAPVPAADRNVSQRANSIRTRDVILLREDVASAYWRRPWAEVVAAADAGDDGVQLRQQAFDQSGTPDLQSARPEKGWASFYNGTERGHEGTLFLHVQNYE